MKIHYKEQTNPTFGDIPVNRFYVDADGNLCQKCTEKVSVQIAKSDGAPFSDYDDTISQSETILRILPEVERIEF